MAITVEQRAAIKKRAQELLASPNPPTMGAAAQQAYAEIVGPKLTDAQKAKEKASLEMSKKQLDFESTRSRYVEKKTADFEKAGIDPLTAQQRATEEFDKSFMAPEIGLYDEGKVPVTPSVPATSQLGKATITTAMRPQTYIPESQAVKEAERAAKPSLIGGVTGPKIDYQKMITDLQDSGLTKQEAVTQAQGFQAAYGQTLVDMAAGYKNKNLIIPKNVAQLAYDKTVADISEIPNKLSDKNTYIKEAPKAGLQDPLYLAFSKQYEAGEGIPSLNSSQSKYVQRVAELERKSAKERLVKEYEGKPVIVPDPTSSEVRGATKKMIELKDAERDKWLEAKAASEVEIPWWSDPAEVKRRLADPEKYKQEGVLTTETPLGGKQETNVGWLLRSALTVPNIVAGTVFPYVFQGTGETQEALEAARKRARPDAYKESPVLYNIAQNRGFVGEAKDVSDALGLDKDVIAGPVTLGTIYTAGLFAADMLDPSLDIIASGIKGTKAGLEATKIAKEAGVSLKATEAAKFGGKSFLENLAKENAVINVFGGKKYYPGDVRLLIAEKMAPEAEAAVGLRPLAGTELEKEAAKLGSVDEAVESSKLLSQATDDVKALRAAVGAVEGEKHITYDKLLEAFNEADARNPERFANVSSERGDIIKLLSQNSDAMKDVEQALIRQTIRGGVFEATKGSLVGNGLIALTQNTFVSPDVAKQVTKKWVESPLAKEINSLKNNPTFGKYAVDTRPSAIATAKPSVTITGNQQLLDDIDTVLGNAAFGGKYTSTPGVQRTAAGDAVVPLDVIRQVIDIQLDNIAKSFSHVTAKDVAKLEPLVSREFRKPIEIRDVSGATFKKLMQDNIKKPSSPLTPAQEAFVDSALSKINGLDKKLRSDMSKALSDVDFRKAYNIPDGVKDRRQVVQYLITGPGENGSFKVNGVKDTLKSMVDNAFYSKRYQPSIFNNFDGIDRKTYTDIWSTVGRDKLAIEIDKAAHSILANPNTFEENMTKLVDYARELTKQDENIIVSASEVIDGLKGKKELPTEVLVGSYYNAEARRAYNETLKELVKKAEGDISYRTYDAQSPAVKNYFQGDEEFIAELVSSYTDNLINTPGFAKKTPSEILDAIVKNNLDKNAAISKGIVSDLTTYIAGEAERIMRNNNLVARGEDADEIINLVNKVYTNNDAEQQLKLFIGPKTGDEIISRLKNGGAKEFEAGLRDIMAKTGGDAAKAYGEKLLDFFRSMFYTSILTLAPRFHGMNIIGAPSVIYSTTGIVPGILDYANAAKVMSLSDGAKGSTVIVKDAAGRTYTADELWRAFSEGASRSNYDADIPLMKAWTSNAEINSKGTLSRALGTVMDLANNEDLFFRISVGTKALQEGRTLDEAIKLARAALFDVGDITKAEKKIQNATLFYNFQRNNFINLMKNLTSPNGWKRITNLAKIKRGTEGVLGITEQEKQYAPTQTATRIILGEGGDIGPKKQIITTASIPELQAVELLGQILAGEFSKIAGASLNPLLKSLFEDPKEIERVPAEQVNSIKAVSSITGTSPERIISLLAGEEVVPYKSNEPDAVDGYVYPLLTQSARDKYTSRMGLVAFVGLNRIMSDYPQTVAAQGTKTAYAYESVPGLLGYGVGLTTPIKTISAEEQRLRQVLMKNSEARKIVGDVQDAITEEMKTAPLTPTEETTKKQIEKMVGQVEQMKSTQYGSLDEVMREMVALKAEQSALQSNIIKDPANMAVWMKQAQDLQKRLVVLMKRKAEIEKAMKQGK